MDIMLKLALRYMKKNRKRTIATIIGIIISVIMMTVVIIFTTTFMTAMRKEVIKTEGSYHATFHDLTEQQYHVLKNRKEVIKCELSTHCQTPAEGNSACADVEMKKVGNLIFFKTQRIAKQLGMKLVPEKERAPLPDRSKAKYNVTYHVSLLEYYGVTSYDNMGIGMTMNCIVMMIVILSGIFIYNSYAISVFEKLKYMGVLGSVGATKFQKALAVYWEGLIEGIIGVPIGLLFGILISGFSLHGIRQFLMQTDKISMEISLLSVFGILLAGFATIFIACYFPAKKAAEVSDMDLVIRPYIMNEPSGKKYSLKKQHSILGIEGMLALKNVQMKKARYTSIGITLTVLLCLMLDGYAYMRGLQGKYYTEDTRPRPELEMWVELHTKNTKKIEEFYKQLSENKQINNISLERTLDLDGILIDGSQINEYLKEEFNIGMSHGFAESLMTVTDGSGKEVTGYWVRPYVIGIDENTFSKYAEKADLKWDGNGKYPVIIEDFVEISKNEKEEMKNLLNLQSGEALIFSYNRYGGMSPYGFGLKKLADELWEGEFSVIGTTQEAPPYPYYSGMPDDVSGYQERVKGILRMYMPYSDFNQLLKDEKYKETYGVHPKETLLWNYRDYKSIPTYIKLSIERASYLKQWSWTDKVVFHKDILEQIREDQLIEKDVEQIARNIGMEKGKQESLDLNGAFDYLPEDDTYAFGSKAIWQKNQLLYSQELFQMILGYGIILIILAFSLSNIFQNISMSIRMRRREFALYQSMGMTSGSIYKMLFIENSVYGLIALFVGIPISFFLLTRVFSEFSIYHSIEPIIPWNVIALQFAVIIIMSVVPVIHAFSQLKHLNIIESIKNENL